jgi:hypothetical protein
MGPLLSQPALRFGEDQHDVADLVLVGLISGEWQELENLTARGLGLEAAVSERPKADELGDALAAFRYERRLIAAAELEQWLEERSLALQEVEAVLRRRWLRERFPDDEISDAPDRVAKVVREEALCSGVLVHCAQTLRMWHAASLSDALAAADTEAVDTLLDAASSSGAADLAVPRDEVRRRATRLVMLAASYDRFRAVALSAGAIDARVAERRLEWTVVTGTELSFAREGAARETRLRVVHDGEALAHVAGTLGLEPARRAVELGNAPSGLGAELLAAREGDIVGPWSEQERWRVLEIDGHFRPEDAADDRLRARARDELLSELVDRLAAGKGEIVGAL